MSGRVLRCLAVAVLCGFACSSQVLELDAKSRELIGRADAVLARARTISLVQKRRVVLGQKVLPVEETAILAARPGFFRVEQKGEEVELTVADGTAWFRLLVELGLYQRTEVAGFSPADLFRPPQAEAMVMTGRGLTSLWLGQHSLATLLADAKECTYGGTETEDGVELHRLDVGSPLNRLALFFTAADPPLLRRITLRKDVPLQDQENTASPVMELVFDDWRLDPAVPDGTFVFTPPAGAKQVANVGREQARQRRLEIERRDAGPHGLPFPNGPEAGTSKTHKAALKAACMAIEKRQYETHGHRDPKWDAAVLEFQERWAERMAGDNSLGLMVDLRERLYYIQSLGCQDPVLQYRFANLAQYLEGDSAAAPLLHAAWEAVRASSYPASAKLPALRRHLALLKKSGKPEEKERLGELGSQLVALFAESAGEPDFAAGRQRYFVFLFNLDWNAMSLAEKRQAVEKMAALPNTDPWILAHYTGCWRIGEAWNARGGGYANTVTKEGWRGFAEHLGVAKRELTKAWQLHPEFPESATEMIVVAMAGHAEEPARVWFDRALAAQLDWGDAYDKLRWAYRPRWGGSPSWTYHLGLEAARTGRFDTYAPHHFWLSLLDLLSEGETWQEIMARPEAPATLRAVCEGYLAENDPEYPAEFWQTILLIGCWGAGQDAEALAVLRQLGFQPDAVVCGRAKLDPDRLAVEVMLYAGPQREAGRRGLGLLEDKDYAAAVPVLRQVMLAMREVDARVYAYLGDQICNVPLADAPEVADTVLDTIIELRRREVLVQSFIRWMDESPDEVPAAFQDRVAAYLGPISWAFMQEAPVAGTLGDGEIDAGLARLDGLTLADIPGADTLPAEEANDLFATEKILAKLRLHYCRQLTGNNQSNTSWRYSREHVVPLVKPIPHRGLLLDFVAEHQNPERHSYHRELQRGVKTWIQAQGVAIWDQYSDSFLPQIAELGRIADGAARTEAVWRLFRQRGSLRFGFQIKEFLDQSGATVDAALVERYLVSYLVGQGVPIRDPYSYMVQAVGLDFIPGYERRVIGYSKQFDRSGWNPPESWLAMANAYLRLGELESAITALWEGSKATPEKYDWFYVGGERRKGSDEAMNALVRAISRHPAATPETLELLERLFPERLAQANAQ